MKNITNNIGDFDPTITRPSVFAKQFTMMEYTVHFSQEFEHPSYYDEVVTLLLQAEEGDRINFMINNFGGRIDALNAILNSLSMTRAEVTGFLIGQGCSCASVLLLACHNFVVGNNTTLMIHEQSFWVGGKASETKKQHSHYQAGNDRFIREAYSGFLTNEEIESCLRGEDFYFEDYEIKARLENREDLRKEQNAIEIKQTLDDETTLEVFTDEELIEELKLIQAEIKKRKRMIPSETKRDNIKHMTKKELLGETK